MTPPIRPFKPSYNRTPKYSVKEVSEITGLSSYTIRYYDNAGLIPGLNRTDGNARQFSELCSNLAASGALSAHDRAPGGTGPTKILYDHKEYLLRRKVDHLDTA